ncbi:N-acetylglucosamine 6-phosphate deacetylase [Nocardioides sp.]|uniref:N-acetylglucosamine-6-phosphate deacetylase n=1 Tax=Nocardioides sp. TaxID=35761 RepID=UPI00262EEED3|nr:N-acetylglucosamine 6-phosphate deacetylase [Nocardioides sp.]MDI6912288.1 N-acetylglucosamine 6-phosphate deacetylase [Nocardioides sp.]
MSTVVSGLVDAQVNGAAGIDLTAEPHRLWEVAAALPAYGVVAFVPTVISSDPAARDQALVTLAAGPPAGWSGAEPLGLHFEGPMIAPTRRGAHPERWLRAPALDLVDGWSREAGVAIATIAPELPGALEVIERLTDRGVVVSVGHTAASGAEVAAALEAGARCLTHIGNAMPPLRAREPGPVGAAFGGDPVTGPVAGLIVDGHHLDPLFVRTAWRALGPDRFLSVSDTTAGLGLPDGPARLGDQDVVVADGTVRLADGTLAGSAASLLDCLRILVAQTGCTLGEAVATATTTPLGLLGRPPREERIRLSEDLRLEVD